MRKHLFNILILLATYSFGWAQSESLPLNDFYKVQFLNQSKNEIHENLFPANETHMNLDSLIQDTSVFYSSFPYWLFQRHWVSIEKKKAKLYISPLINFSYGKDITKKSDALFRNTRGIYLKGAIGEKFSFVFAFAENQARFLDYQNDYFNNAGERYVKANGYNRVNAVIPAGSRTKPFKVGAYDYAYAIGMVNYQATKRLRFEFGNQPNFVGIGYRSLMLSDHSINAIGLRTSYQFNDKWSYQWLIKNHKNLYRKPKTNFVESPYENKLFTAVYLTYKPVKNLALSLFSSANALRADSATRHKVQWQSLMPIPILNTDLALKNKVMNGIVGLNLEWALKDWRLYGQLVLDNINLDNVKRKMAVSGQFGTYYFNAFGIKNWMLQVEGNVVPQGFYTDFYNSKLSYTHAQLPLAHPVGNNFGEFVFRTQYEWKRIYADITYNYYRTLSSPNYYGYLDDNTLITDNINTGIVYPYISHGSDVHNLKLEIGWRFNRKYNSMIYFDYTYHSNYTSTYQKEYQVQSIMIGWRTGLFNQYLDF